jgi:type III pantothenate kinase
MKLVLDLGNTNKKICVFQQGRLVHLEISDQLSLRTLKEIIGNYPQITDGIMASVVAIPAYLKNFLEQHLLHFIELNNRTLVPVINKYKTPGRLGKDRLACAVAGSSLFSGFPVLVVNAGTCITYDFVTAGREYLGGAISPGIRMRFKALHTFTEKLPLVDLAENVPLTGDDTENSIASGVVNGAIEEIKGVVRLYRQHHPNLQVVLSGGDADYLDKRLKIRIFAFPNIVLVGLYEILEYNLKNAR